MTTKIAGLPASTRLARSATGRGRILVAMRWPLGGIRTHILYNAPTAQEHGYRFTFVGPDDESFDTFTATFADFSGVEFLRVPVRGKSCPIWRSVRRELRTGRYALLHSHGLTAAI